MLTYLKKIIECIIRFCDEVDEAKQKKFEKGLDDYCKKKISVWGLIKVFFLPTKLLLILTLSFCSLIIIVEFLKIINWNIIIPNIGIAIFFVWLIISAYQEHRSEQQNRKNLQIYNNWLFYANKIIVPALSCISYVDKELLYTDNLFCPNYTNSSTQYYYSLPMKFPAPVRLTQKEMESLLYRSIKREYAKCFHLRTTDTNIAVTFLGDCFCLEFH